MWDVSRHKPFCYAGKNVPLRIGGRRSVRCKRRGSGFTVDQAAVVEKKDEVGENAGARA